MIRSIEKLITMEVKRSHYLTIDMLNLQRVVTNLLQSRVLDIYCLEESLYSVLLIEGSICFDDFLVHKYSVLELLNIQELICIMLSHRSI